MTEITICMGSSCFSRGNSLNAAFIQKFVEEHGLSDQVRFKGCLCENECKGGPNVKINGKMFTQVEPAGLELILRHELGL